MSHHRDDLLRQARKSRTQWILRCKDETHPPAKQSPASSLVYASSSVQAVYDFLSSVAEDGEFIDLQVLAASASSSDPLNEDDDELNTSNIELLVDPLSDYNTLLYQWLHPSCSNIVKSLQQFVNKFHSISRKDAGQSDQQYSVKTLETLSTGYPSMIWTYLDSHLYPSMREISFWSMESVTESDFETIVKPNCEKFLFTKLYDLLFGLDSEDQFIDIKSKQRIDSLSFLTAEHLDIKTLQFLIIDSFTNNDRRLEEIQRFEAKVLEKAIEALREMDKFKSPNDKLSCVKKCSIHIAQLLKEVYIYIKYI